MAQSLHWFIWRPFSNLPKLVSVPSHLFWPKKVIGCPVLCFILWPTCDMDVSKNRGTLKSSILKGFSITNYPFWGTPIFWKHHETPISEFVDILGKTTSFSMKLPVTESWILSQMRGYGRYPRWKDAVKHQHQPSCRPTGWITDLQSVHLGSNSLRDESHPVRMTCSDHGPKYHTPRKINMEPENTPLQKENHLPNHHFQVLC